MLGTAPVARAAIAPRTSPRSAAQQIGVARRCATRWSVISIGRYSATSSAIVLRGICVSRQTACRLARVPERRKTLLRAWGSPPAEQAAAIWRATPTPHTPTRPAHKSTLLLESSLRQTSHHSLVSKLGSSILSSFARYLATMPGVLKPEFSKLQITELHPTFVAEIEGVDFTQPIPDDVFAEILAASAKVSRASS